jgi:hypothetical protein
MSADAASQEKTVFMQVYKQLGHLDPSCLRQNERAFKVTLRRERVEGEGTAERPSSRPPRPFLTHSTPPF